MYEKPSSNGSMKKRVLKFDKDTLYKISQLYSTTGDIQIIDGQTQNTRTLGTLLDTLGPELPVSDPKTT